MFCIWLLAVTATTQVLAQTESQPTSDTMSAGDPDASLAGLISSVKGEGAIVDESNPNNVIMQSMAVVIPGREDAILDLTGDLTTLQDQVIHVKEGAEFKLRLQFIVQREIVSGLRYHHVLTRGGIKADKKSYLVGSYGPRAEPISFLTPTDEFPKGLIQRGRYYVTSRVIDDDKVTVLTWEWSFEVGRDWL